MGKNVVILLDIDDDGKLTGVQVHEGGEVPPVMAIMACRAAGDLFKAQAQEAEIERRVAAALVGEPSDGEQAGAVEVEHDQLTG